MIRVTKRSLFLFPAVADACLEKCEIAKDYHNVHPEVDFNGVVCYVRISAVQLWNSENSLSFPTSKVWAAKGCNIFFVFRRLVGLADFLFWHTIWCSLWEHSRFVGTVHLSKLQQPCTAVSPGYGQLQDQVGRWRARFHFTGFTQWSCWPKPTDHPCFFQWKVNWISSLWPFVGGAHFSRFFFCCFQILTTISCSCRSSYRSRLQRGVEIRFVGHGRDWAASWLDSKAGSGIQNMKNIEFFSLKHYLYHVPSRASLYWILRIYSSVW